jgi:dephospho-CoA kinase
MRPHRERMIAVMAEPGVVLGRLRKSRQDARTLEGLKDQEFSSVRQEIYDMAQHRVDNSGDIDKHARQLADFIRCVMAPTGS